MFSLGAVNALDMVIQVVLPMILVRLLNEQDFSLYRALWLLTGTTQAVFAMAIPASLFYFLPRNSRPEGSVYLVQAAGYMFAASALSLITSWTWATSHGIESLQRLQVAAFVACWLFSTLLESMFNAQQRVARQAQVNLFFALMRLLLVVAAAWVFRSWTAVLIAHVGFGLLKALACMIAVRRHAVPGTRPSRVHWREQFRYAVPFGISTALSLTRQRIDQWMVASVYSSAQFGLYSVASVFTPIQGLIRATVNQLVLPELNRLEAQADLKSMQAINQRGNIGVALIMFPTLAFIAAWAFWLLALLFTANYSGAAAAVQAYCLALLIDSMEVVTLLIALRQGRFMMFADAVLLVLTVLGSLLGAYWFGLTGAALGQVVGSIGAQLATYVRCSQLTQIPIRELQAWSVLAKIAAAAVFAAFCSRMVMMLFPSDSALAHLIPGALIFVIAYYLALRFAAMSGRIREIFGLRLARLVGF